MKKLLGTLSAIFFCVVVLSITASAEDVTNEERFLGYFGITDSIDIKSDTPITRAEFAAMLIRALNYTAAASVDDSFEDVTESTPFATEIYAAKALSITNGTSATTFSPDEPIVTDGACKMTVIALGYGEYANALGASGYSVLAGRLKLGSGISSGSGTLSRTDAVILIYNALNTNVNEITGISADEITYANNGIRLIEKSFRLTAAEGVVTTAGYVSDSEADSDEYTLVVGDKTLRCIFPAGGYMGMSVTAWYDAKTNEVVAIDEWSENSMVMLYADDIIGYSDFELTIDEDGKEKKLKFDKSFGYIKNGRIINHSDSDFNFDGIAVVRDNNGDGLYDYFLGFHSEYFVVSSINHGEGIAYDINSDLRFISLEPDDGECMVFTVDASNAEDASGLNFTRCTSSVIEEDGVYMVFRSDDSKVCVVVASADDSSIVTAKLAEFDGESYTTVDGKKYKLNQYFAKRGIALGLGNEYELCIAPDGTLTDVKGAVGKNCYYGYVLATAVTGGIDSTPRVKILSQDGKYLTLDFANKVKINGVTVSYGSAAYTKLGDGATYVRQLIKYSLNPNGEVSVVDTAKTAEVTDCISASYDTSDSLAIYVSQASGQYKVSGNLIIPKFSIKKAIIFTVPSNLASDPYGDYDDEAFRVSSASVLNNDGTYTLDAYDFDEDYFPAAVVIYCNSSASTETSTATQYTGSFMVINVTDVNDADGTPTKKVYGFRNRKHVEYTIDPGVLPQLQSEGRIPSAGDVIRAVFNTDNEITGISIDMKYNYTTGKPVINYGAEQLSTAANSYFTYVGGQVITIGSESMVIYADQVPTSSAALYLGGIAPISLSSPQYVIFNTTTGEVYEGRQSDLLGGEEGAQYAVCKMNYYLCNTVFIYVK